MTETVAHPRSLVEFDVASLEQELRAGGQVISHAQRILRAFYDAAGEPDWERVNISNAVRAWLRDAVLLDRPSVLHHHHSADGTGKFLLGFARGGAVECVLMPSHRPDRAAGCVSSQIGCAMGCDFCASTKSGLERNLTAGEIVEQFLLLKREALRDGRRLSSLVFMGMGEPMQNLENVIGAIRRIADPAMGALGWRQITVSTVGIVPGIDRLADANLNVHLALSLHAPDDATRARLVPMNRRWKVAEIVAAARRFQQRTGRIVTIEYCMLAGVNDSDAQAELLAQRLQDFRAHVNLIPYNPIGPGLSGAGYIRPSEEQVAHFARVLQERGVVVHARRPRGDDVAAACGQLRRTLAHESARISTNPDLHS
jgi:23S rRNA (adenine2503-C2)-methyltransferase